MHFADAVHDLVVTLDRNLQAPEERPLFEGVAWTPRLNARMLPIFRRRVADRGQKLLDMLDEWLSREEIPGTDEDSDGRGVRAGVGIYLFEDPEPGSRSKES